MIDILKMNLKSFSKEKTFKNFIIISLFLLLAIFFMIILNKKINSDYAKMINDESNRVFYIEDKENYVFVNEFIRNNLSNFEHIFYMSEIIDYRINEDLYNIIYVEDFDENNFAVNSNLNGNSIRLFGLNVNNNYDNKLTNTIIINQKLSKYLYDNMINLLTTSSIEIKVDDYYKYCDYINILANNKIKYRENNDINENINIIENTKKLTAIFMLLFIVIFIIVNLFLINSILKYDKKNILIYRSVGLCNFKIVLIYFYTYLVYSLIISFIIMLLSVFLNVLYEFILCFLIMLLISFVLFLCLFKKYS